MTRYWFFIDNGDDTAREQSMEIGKYYWVLVTSSRKDPEWQPARFTGIAGDSVGATWDYIGFRSDDGHHFVNVIGVGPEIPLHREGMMAVSEALRTDEEAAP